MVILINNKLDCQIICDKIKNLINKSLSGVRDTENYAICISITKIVDEKKMFAF